MKAKKTQTKIPSAYYDTIATMTLQESREQNHNDKNPQHFHRKFDV